MYLKKIYTIIFISIINIVLLQATEDFSVSVILKDRNITSLSQLIPADSKYDYGKGYYLPIEVSYTNNTDTVQHLLLSAPCSYIESSWEAQGNLKLIKEMVSCRSLQSPRSIIVRPKEKLKHTCKLLFPKSYLHKRVRFKIGFKKIIDNPNPPAPLIFESKHILTYWSKWIIINADSERIDKK